MPETETVVEVDPLKILKLTLDARGITWAQNGWGSLFVPAVAATDRGYGAYLSHKPKSYRRHDQKIELAGYSGYRRIRPLLYSAEGSESKIAQKLLEVLGVIRHGYQEDQSSHKLGQLTRAAREDIEARLVLPVGWAVPEYQGEGLAAHGETKVALKILGWDARVSTDHYQVWRAEEIPAIVAQLEVAAGLALSAQAILDRHKAEAEKKA